MTSIPKILKIILKVVTSIIVIVFTILFVIQVIIIVHFDRIIEDSLKETILEATDDLYSINFDNLSVNVFTGTIKAKKVHLRPDTLVYKRLKELQKAPNLIFDIYIPDFQVSRINLYDTYFNKELNLHKIYIKDLELALLNEPQNKLQTPKKDPLDLYSLISSVFKRAEAESIEIVNGSFVYKQIKDNQMSSQTLQNVTLKFTDVNIDSAANADTTNFLYSDDIYASIQNYTIKLLDSLYIFNLGKASLSTKQSQISFENIKLTPTLKKSVFFKKLGKQGDRLTITVKNSVLQKVNIRKLLDEQKLQVKNLIIENIQLQAFRDKRIPREKNFYPKMPQQILREMKFGIDIKILKVRKMNIAYEEISEKGGPAGKVTFSNIFARVTNINNDSLAIANGQTIWIKAEGNLMGKGFIQAKFKLPLNSINDAYTYKGSLGPMDLRELNPIIKPLTRVEIKDGKVKFLEFDVTANNDRAKGLMKFQYNDLKIQLLDNDTEDGGIKERIGSFIANKFIVESDNIMNESFRTGKISFKRDKSRFIFNYWWKTLLSGVKPSVGLTEEKQKSIKDFKDKLEEIKRKRSERKQERQERRLEKKNKDLSRNQ